MKQQFKAFWVYTGWRFKEVEAHLLKLGYRYTGELPLLSADTLFISKNKELKWGYVDRIPREEKDQELSIADVLALQAPRYEFKPFDKVLVRDTDDSQWYVDIFAHQDSIDRKYPYDCFRTSWKQCIPYEGNEHLLGTTDPE